MNLVQRLVLFLSGRVFIGYQTRPGWRGWLPFYAFKCKRHGVVESYPQGYSGTLLCPKCLREMLET